MLEPLPIRLVPADTDLSYEAGMLRPPTAAAGLSLGDRYCRALAKRYGAIAVTADRQWAKISGSVEIAVHLI